MFQDVGVSKDLNEQFRTHLQSSGETLDSKLFFGISLCDMLCKVIYFELYFSNLVCAKIEEKKDNRF